MNPCPRCDKGTFRVSAGGKKYREQCLFCDYEKVVPDQRVTVIHVHFNRRKKEA